MENSKEKKIVTKKITRRGFFKRAGKWVGALAVIELGSLVFYYLKSGGKVKATQDDTKYITAGNVDDFLPNSVTPYRNGFLYLSRLQDGGFLAMSIKCIHLGCSIVWNKDKDIFLCPCHHSKFKINGEVLTPPATRALDLYEILIENGIVKININKKLKRKKFNKNQAVYV